MTPTKRRADVNEHKQKIERTVIYGSMLVQALLTFSVVGFCAYQLNRCPVNDRDTSDGSGVYDTPQCPRALYTNMITAAVASWFPSPFYSLVSLNNSFPDERSPTGRSTDKRLTKDKPEDKLK